MAGERFSERPLSLRSVAAAAAALAAAAGVTGHALTGLDLRLAPLLVIAGTAAAVLCVLRERHRLRVHAGRLTVGSVALGGFAVPLADVERWQVLSRAEAFELRAALRGQGRVAFLPWLPAAAHLVAPDGRVYLVGTRHPERLRSALRDAAPHREAAGDLARMLADVEAADAATSSDPGGAASGSDAVLLLGVTGLFGPLVTLVVLNAARSLPFGLATIGMVAAPVLGALVVAEAASRTPLAPAWRVALAAACVGMTPPAAAAVAGVPLTGVVFLAVVTVPAAFVTATLYPGARRRA